MNKLLFLIYGILFLIVTLYLLFQKNTWSIFTFSVGLTLILLYVFLPESSEEVTPPKSPSPSKSPSPPKSSELSPSPIGVLPKFSVTETLQSPVLRNTFNYINDPQTDGSTGRLEYGGDKNMRRWGIKTLNYTHVKFIDGFIFKLRNPNSSDSYGYFVDIYGKQAKFKDDAGKIIESPPNFFTDYIQLGTFS